jgi:preprotein translocase subunit YajC
MPLHPDMRPSRVRRNANWAVKEPRNDKGFSPMFVSPAYAQAAGGAGGAFASFVPLILIFAIMYFLLIRPQQKKVKEHAAMVEAVRRGDQIITQGGIIGKVTKVMADESGEVEVEIAKDTRVRLVKSTIANVINKTEPAK